MTEGSGDNLFQVIHDRYDYLATLADDRLHKPALTDRLGVSRSTVDRAIRELEEYGLVEKGAGGYAATLTGQLATAHHNDYCRSLEELIAARQALEPLPPDAPVDIDAVTGGEPTVATEPTPYEPRELLAEATADATVYRAVLPTLPDIRHLRLVYDRVTAEDATVDLLVSDDLLNHLREEFPVRLPALAAADNTSIQVGDPPPFGVLLTEHNGVPAVTIISFGTDGTLHGVVHNETEGAVEWAQQWLIAQFEAATDVTPRLAAEGNVLPADGGVAVAGAEPETDLSMEARLITLEDEGFRRVDSTYLVDQDVVAPATALRTGLELSEVHAGYAVERHPPESEDETFQDSLIEQLRAGDDVAVVGPPGSGKSTICRRVACEWYRQGKPVLYRQSGRGAPVEATDVLQTAARETDGHALVVVEDVVRPDAVGALRAARELAGTEAVTFLFDARTSEWRDPPGVLEQSLERYRTQDTATLRVPPLTDADRRRIADHIAETVDSPVDVSLEDLQRSTADDGTAPHELVLFAHRLAASVDPLDESPTSLESGVEDVYEQLAEIGSGALHVGALATLLITAGLPVNRSLLRTASPADQAATTAAIDQLVGTVLFERDQDTYRTVHEVWAAAFLDHLLDRDGDAEAAVRIGRCLSGLEAADPDAWPGDHTSPGDGRGAAGLSYRPIESAARQLYAVTVEYSKLAPLFVDPETHAPWIPDGASASLEQTCLEQIGVGHYRAGRHEVATTMLEQLRERAVATDAQAPLATAHRYLGRIAAERGDLDAAAEALDAGLEVAQAAEEPGLPGQLHAERARIERQAGEFEAARDRLELALERTQRDDLPRATADILAELGNVRSKLGDRAGAREVGERALELYRELGDGHAVAEQLTSLAVSCAEGGDLETARRHASEALDHYCERGEPVNESHCLHILGTIESIDGDLDRAIEYTERAIELGQEAGATERVYVGHESLARYARLRDDYDRAAEHARTCIELVREADATQDLPSALQALADTEYERGNLDRAAEVAEEAVERARDIGSPKWVAGGLLTLAAVAMDREEFDPARDYATDALNAAREDDNPRPVSNIYRVLIDVETAAGESDQAVEWCDRAREWALDNGLAERAERFRERRRTITEEAAE